MPRRDGLRCPRGAPDEPGSLPQVAHRPGGRRGPSSWRGGVPQHPLHHLRVSASTQPERRRRMAQVMNPERPGHRPPPGRPPADRALPVRLAQRAALRSTEQPIAWCLACAPPIHDRHQPRPPAAPSEPGCSSACPRTARRRHSLASTARRQPQARTRDRDRSPTCRPGQLTPAQPSQREHGHHVAVRALACRRQRVHFGQGECLSLPTEPGRWSASEPPPPRCAEPGHRPRRTRGWTAAWPGRGSQSTGPGPGPQSRRPSRHLRRRDRAPPASCRNVARRSYASPTRRSRGSGA